MLMMRRWLLPRCFVRCRSTGVRFSRSLHTVANMAVGTHTDSLSDLNVQMDKLLSPMAQFDAGRYDKRTGSLLSNHGGQPVNWPLTNFWRCEIPKALIARTTNSKVTFACFKRFAVSNSENNYWAGYVPVKEEPCESSQIKLSSIECMQPTLRTIWLGRWHIRHSFPPAIDWLRRLIEVDQRTAFHFLRKIFGQGLWNYAVTDKDDYRKKIHNYRNRNPLQLHVLRYGHSASPADQNPWRSDPAMHVESLVIDIDPVWETITANSIVQLHYPVRGTSFDDHEMIEIIRRARDQCIRLWHRHQDDQTVFGTTPRPTHVLSGDLFQSR